MATDQMTNVAPATDEARAIATITIAFSNDPVTRWVLPDANFYLTHWPAFVKAFGGAAFDHGTADAIDACGGVALCPARCRAGRGDDAGDHGRGHPS
jgi:hypothetical protein